MVVGRSSVMVTVSPSSPSLPSWQGDDVTIAVPVVFLVLPVTVMFALFPGFYGLRLVAG